MSNKFDFPVEMRELFTVDGLKANRKAVVRTDTNKILADVGKHYKLVHHSGLFDMANEYMQKFGDFTANFTDKGGGQHIMAEYTFKNIVEEVKKGDEVGFKLYFQNSYDGKSSVRLGLMGLRLACLNGMTAPYGETHIAFRHGGDHIEDGKLVNIDFPKPDLMLKGFKTAVKHWSKLAEKELDETGIRALQHEAVMANIIPQSIEKNDDFEELSAWGLYNQFTHHITHSNPNQGTQIGRLQRYDRVARWFADTFQDTMV